MKPFKAGQPLSSWLLRVSLIASIVVTSYQHVLPINLKSFIFYKSVIFLLMTILLLIGGLLSKSTLTILSGLIVFGFSSYLIFANFEGLHHSGLYLYFIWASIGFYFFCNGNK